MAELYAPDAYYANQGNDCHGAAGVEVAITRNWDKFISHGYTFKVADGTTAHRRSARVPWLDERMAEAATYLGHRVVIVKGRVA
jgi:hypothetical protein